MTDEATGPYKAYRNPDFLAGRDGRPIRILAEYIEPEARFEDFRIADTIVFFGSARLKSRHDAEDALAAARTDGGDVAAAERSVAMSRYYEEARSLAARLTEWSKGLEGTSRRFVICSGGGPGIMEAANRGAEDAGAPSVGLNIVLPHEQEPNRHITPELSFQFHYFALRKMHFLMRARGLVVLPGGYGTMDELFETLTLIQTGKVAPMPILLFGKAFWGRIVDFDAMVEEGVIAPEDRALFRFVETAEEAVDTIRAFLAGEE